MKRQIISVKCKILNRFGERNYRGNLIKTLSTKNRKFISNNLLGPTQPTIQLAQRKLSLGGEGGWGVKFITNRHWVQNLRVN